MTARPAPVPAPGSFESYLPIYVRSDGPYGPYLTEAKKVCGYVTIFIQHNLDWLREEKIGAIKTLLIKFPDAIVLISNRIGPSTYLPGKLINRLAHILRPIHKLGPNASTLFGFVDVINKFDKMFEPSATRVEYVVKDGADIGYKAQFPLHRCEQISNRVGNIAVWALSVSGCAEYIWKLDHTPLEPFPLKSSVTCIGISLNLKGIYEESRFLYQTLWCTPKESIKDEEGEEIFVPIRRMSLDKEKIVPVPGLRVANEELAGSLFRLSLSVACLSIDIFKALAVKDNNPKWLDTALFCAGLAPTFIAPLAMRYWPKMVVDPLRTTAVA
jgi:hypothetical protein